jgi:hypothetical protein
LYERMLKEKDEMMGRLERLIEKKWNYYKLWQMLYKRNYFELTVDETNKIKKAQQFLEKAQRKN